MVFGVLDSPFRGNDGGKGAGRTVGGRIQTWIYRIYRMVFWIPTFVGMTVGRGREGR